MRSRLVATRRRVCVLAALVGLALAGCAAGSTPASGPALPPVGGGLDYQLGGAYDPPAGVDIVVRDSTDEPAAGLYSVCYLNGFQTQPADSEPMLADSPELILTANGGRCATRTGRTSFCSIPAARASAPPWPRCCSPR